MNGQQMAYTLMAREYVKQTSVAARMSMMAMVLTLVIVVRIILNKVVAVVSLDGEQLLQHLHKALVSVLL